jgi:hypothetical protein
VIVALASQPAPQVHVPAPDLSELLHVLHPQEHVPQAIETLDYVAIGEAVGNAVAARQIAGTDRTDEVIGELRKIGQKFGRALANSMPVVSSDISSNPTRVLGQVEVTALPSTDRRTLAERMFAKAPQADFTLWLDTADAGFIYIAEAPSADVGTASTFRGIRVTKDAAGNPLGKVQTASSFAWDSRSSAGWA